MNEADFIAALRLLAPHPAARGLSDDAAVLEIGGQALVITHDMLVEGVHFLPDADPADVAWRLVATNLSDLAAKGAVPLGVVLGYQLGGGEARFLDGLAQALAAYNVPLLGGDTVGTPAPGAPQTLGLTALGRATCQPVPARSGAQVGDIIGITGPVGAAMLGLEALRAHAPDPAASLAYRRPQALLAQGQALAPHVHAMMDVSDGLLLDAARMGTASGVCMAITAAAVPIATPEARRAQALRWGDDYQLLFTAPPNAALPVPHTRIGIVQAPQGAPLLVDGAAPNAQDALGYQH